MPMVVHYSSLSDPSPTYVAICVSLPFGSKKWLTFANLHQALVALPSIQKRYMFLHSFIITNDVIKCTVEYTAGGSLGQVKISSVHNELDAITLSFFTEKYSPKTGNLFNCCIYEVDGATARFHDHDLHLALQWIQQLFPECTMNESCKITNITCDMFTVIHRLFA